ncbi:MAG: hypothetical protein ACH34X_08830 [Thiolinea sp.]
MKFTQIAKKYGARVAVAGTALGALVSANLAHAGLAADVQTAIASAGTEAVSVGGYIVAAIASLLVVFMVISLMRKAS